MCIYVLLNVFVNSMWGKEISPHEQNCAIKLCYFWVTAVHHLCRVLPWADFTWEHPEEVEPRVLWLELYWWKTNIFYKLEQWKCWQLKLKPCDETEQNCNRPVKYLWFCKEEQTQSLAVQNILQVPALMVQRLWGWINVMHLCEHIAIYTPWSLAH